MKKDEKIARLTFRGIFLLLLFAGSLASAGDDKHLGTVLLSPAEREALEKARKGQDVDPNANVSVEDTAPKITTYSVSGIVTRRNKKSIAWLNGQPIAEAPPAKELPPINFHRDRLVIDGKPVKVGEILDVGSGQRYSPLPAGAYKVKP